MNQTLELLKFSVALGTKVSDALSDDNKVSAYEGIGIAMTLFGPGRAALLRIKEVPAELKSLSPADVETLGAAIYGDVAAHGDPWVTAVANAGIGFARELANLLHVIGNKPNWDNPPVAKVVPE